MHALHQALVQSLSEGQPALNRLLESAIRYVRTEHQKECEHPSHRKPSAAVAIFRCSSESIEYLVLGDASIVLESSEGVVHVTDQRMHRIAKDLRHTILDRLQQGRGYDDPVRTALLRDLVEQEQRARNTASDYPIAATSRGLPSIRLLSRFRLAVPSPQSIERFCFPMAQSAWSFRSVCVPIGASS